MNDRLSLKKRHSHSLRSKGILSALMVVVVCVGSMAVLSILQMTRFATNVNKKAANAQIEGIALAVQLPMNVGDYDQVQRLLDSVVAGDKYLISCEAFDYEGAIIAKSVQTLQSEQGWSLNEGDSYQTHEIEIEPIDMDLGLDLGFDIDEALDLDADAPDSVDLDSEEIVFDTVGKVVLKRSNAGINQARIDQIVSTLSVGGVIALAAMLVGSFIVRRLLLRLNLLVHASEALSLGDYSNPTPNLGRDEIGDLGRAFERMRQAVETHGQQLYDLNNSLQEKVDERTKELQHAVEQAEAANETKTDFLANMSHEIRTPMTAILGYTELLTADDVSTAQREDYTQTILRNGNFLLSIINDILDISKVEAGKMTIERIETEVPVLVEEVMSLMRVRSREKGLVLNLEYASEIPQIAMIDPLRTRQILMNLVGNAIKFTEKGAVKVVVGYDRLDDSEKAPLWFEVHDTGIGMTQQQIKSLFVAFSQADSTMSRRFGGSGLGLSISKSLTELQGGEITVRSTPNEGSVFTVRLDPGVKKGTLMFAQMDTAHFDQPDEKETVDIQRVTTEPLQSAPLEGIRILLAEDGPDNQKLISHVLKKSGALVTIAENGKIAMETYLKNKATPNAFHLILMDMQMPEMDGYTATGLLRKQGETIPIIALTAHAMSGDRDRCIKAGCDDYSTKPIKRKELIALCKSWASFDQRKSA